MRTEKPSEGAVMGLEFSESPQSKGSSFSCLSPELLVDSFVKTAFVKSNYLFVCFSFLIIISFSFEKESL